MKIINLKFPYRLIIFFISTTFLSCGSYKTIEFSIADTPSKPDYSKNTSWAVLPSKYREDFKEYASKELDTLKADVFYIYPTLNTSKKDVRWNVPIDDTVQNEKVLGSAVLMQASAFATVGKIYVPYYRQAHLRSYTMLKSGGKQALELAYKDVKRSFEFYLKNYNKGRPILLASHSQGTTHAIQLLSDFFDGKELHKQLIAAYIPGIGIKSTQFKNLRPMKKPTEIGGYVSWNTFKRNHYPKEDKDWYNGSVTTNPVTWDSNTITSLEQHKGFLYSNGKIYNNALKIKVIDGLIWSSNPKFPLRFFMSFLKNYHVGDINLFWQDIRENAHLRLRTFLEKTN